jgi:copper chaperone CopZ
MACCERPGGGPAKQRSMLGSVALALAGGLLSSSCCTVQLVLNYLSLGCAGFAAITPYKGYLQMATGSVLAYSIVRHGWRRSLATIVMSLGLMFSQEGLKLYNRGALPGLAWARGGSGPRGAAAGGGAAAAGGGAAAAAAAAAGGGAAAATAGAGAQQDAAGSRFTLRVQGIKCEGCAARLKHALLAQPGVRDAAVYYQEQQAVVWTRGRGAGLAELVFAIKQVDFGYQVGLLEEAREAAGGEAEAEAAQAGGQGEGRQARQGQGQCPGGRCEL